MTHATSSSRLPRRILVTGASGTIGRTLLRTLVDAGASPRAAYRTRRPELPAVEAVRLDVATGEGVDDAMAGVETMFLLVGDMPEQAAAELRLVDAAVRAGVSRIVKLSTGGAEAEGCSIARLHRTVERGIEASGLRHTFLRPNCFMQNFVTYYRDAIVTQDAFYLPSGAARVAFIDAGDIARAATRVLLDDGHGGVAYELSGPEALTHGEAADELSRAAGRAIRYVDLSDEAFRETMSAIGMPTASIDDVVGLCRVYRAGGAARVTPHVEALTGRAPRSFRDFAREHAALWSVAS